MRNLIAYLKKHSTLSIIIGAIVIIIAAIAGQAARKQQGGGAATDAKPLEQLLQVKNYSQSTHTVSANGTVESLNQVDLKSQSSGKITRINVKVGDHVRTGQVLAAIDPGTAGAALTSAQGGLAQAQANLAKLLAGASSEQIDAAKVAVDNATTALANTKTSMDTAVQNSFSSLLNSGLTAVAGSSNLGSAAPTISGTYTGSAQGEYNISIYATGSGLKFQSSGLETAFGDVKSQPVALGKLGLYLQFSATPQTSDTWTIAIPNTYSAAYVANNNAYQSALKARDTAVAAAQGQLNSAEASLVQLQAQARPADVQAAQAQVQIAQGQVQAASAAYQNTLIVAPFDGIVSALPIKFADVVSPGQKMASLVSQGGLQIKVFVSGADLPFIQLGGTVKIGTSQATGTVTNLAPSVDATSRTAETDIAVINPASSGLTVGQNVAVQILGSATAAKTDSYVLPLQAVKLTADGRTLVYILDSQSKAQEVAVTTGKVDGEQVEVTSGITNDMQILSNAYDVTAGDTVEIQN